MTSEGTSNLTTHVESSFDPEVYASEFFSENTANEFVKETTGWIFDEFHSVFHGGTLHGKRLLDVGSGPVIYPVIQAAKWYDEIYLSDKWKTNVDYLHKWRRGESQHMKYIMEYFAKKDISSQTWESLNQQVADKIKDIVVFDINPSNPFTNSELEGMKFDTITTSLCLQAAALTMEEFKGVLQNIRDLIQPGGYLVAVDIIDQASYVVGNMKFKTLASSSEEIQTVYKDCGFNIDLWRPKTFVLDPTTTMTIYSVIARNPL